MQAAATGELSAPERSYPASEVRGGWEELPHAPKPEARGGGREDQLHAPKPEAGGSGQEELPRVRGQGRLGGATPFPHA